MQIRQALETDAPAITTIFNYWIENSVAIWLPEPVSVSQRLEWMRARTVFVALIDGDIVGFAGFGPWQDSPGYRFTASDSIYIAPSAQGCGVGAALMAELIDAARAQGYTNMIAAIEAGNAGSIALHQKCGFERVGTLPGVGFKSGRALDLTYFQLTLA